MPNAPIAGPRRVRPAPPPKEPAAAVVAARPGPAPTPSHSAAPPPPPGPIGRGSTRALPPLDYDDTGSAPRPSTLEATRPGRRRGGGGSSRVRWFVLGIAFGAVAAVLARGDAMGTLHAARAWGASTLRSLEHRPATAVHPSAVAGAEGSPSAALAVANGTPCPVDPAPGDPCGELLAPFAESIPTVRVEDLPAAPPEPAALPVPTVVVVAPRRNVARRAAVAPSPRPPAEEESAETERAPMGIHPDEEDAPARPTKVVPTAAPLEHPVVPDAPTEQKSARNEET